MPPIYLGMKHNTDEQAQATTFNPHLKLLLTLLKCEQQEAAQDALEPVTRGKLDV